MNNIPARAEVILEEIELDVTRHIRSFLGCENDQITRDVLAGNVTSYLYGFDEIQSAIVLCDEGNNSIETVDQGELHMNMLFVIDGISFRADFAILPTLEFGNPEIRSEFTMRKDRNDLDLIHPTCEFVDLGAALVDPDAEMIALRDAIIASQNIISHRYEAPVASIREAYPELPASLRF